MRHRTDTHRSAVPKHPYRVWRARIICAGLLWLVAIGAHAASIYQCTDTHGNVTFRDTPCTANTQQTKRDIAGQPLIDPGAPRQRPTRHADSHVDTRSRRARNTGSARKPKQAVAWECRAADGEVFYRYTRCPGSVPGDGVVRERYMQTLLNPHARGHHNAWSRVHVHGVKITRAAACRNIHAVAASGRDGYLRDANVSTYDHLMGRDPCNGY